MLSQKQRSLVLASCLSFLVAVQVQAQQQTGQRTGSNQATLFETKADIKAFSKRLDRADGQLERTDAAVDLCYLYLRVVGDERFFRSEVLQGNRGRIASRLQRVRDQILKEQRRTEVAAQKAARIAARNEASSRKRNSQREYVARDQEGDQESDTRQPSSIDGLESAVIDKQWLMLAHAVGGGAPSMYYSSGLQGTSGHVYRGLHGKPGGIPDDNGDELLSLIQTIIHPDFWDVNGGPGSGHYYQPLRILVVRATQRVHDDMTNLLIRLRGQL